VEYPDLADLAPIVLFVYNRPEHTRRTLAALAASSLATKSDLIIYADGPKKPGHIPGVEDVRKVVRATAGFKSVSVIEREENIGLARSITSGVTEVCEAHGRAIVLEDDLVVAPEFLSYMNRALDRYANENRVMQISGYMFPISRPERLPDAFFSTLSTTWGWATWRRAWSALELDADVLLAKVKLSGRKTFDRNGSYTFSNALVGQRGRFDVWGIRWYASMFANAGLCLHPARSLVRNIGMDGSGENCGPSQGYEVEFGEMPGELPDIIAPCSTAEAQIELFFRELKGSIFNRFTVGIKGFVARALRELRT
jgi:hypothetical protein